MIRFTTYLSDMSEMSLDDVRQAMIASINSANNKDLVTMYRAMGASVETRLLRKGLVDLFKARGLTEFIDHPPFDDFAKKIYAVKADVEVKSEFLNQAINGELFDSTKFIASKHGNIKSLVSSNNPVLTAIYPWMIAWAPQIDSNSTVTVGSAEAFLILLSKGGMKGSNEGAGDVKIGSKMIEIKTGGGGLGKEGPKYWTAAQDIFVQMAQSAVPALKSMSKAELIKMTPLYSTKGKEKSIGLNKMSNALKDSGKSDHDISLFWQSFIQAVLGTHINGSIITKNGVTDYDSWMRYVVACAFQKYKIQAKFDMLTLLNHSTGEYSNFTSGDDMFANEYWNFDNSLTWHGGAQGGVLLSPRIYLGAKKAATYTSDEHVVYTDTQYKNILAFVDAALAASTSKSKKFDRPDQMLKALEVDPHIDHTVKLGSTIKDESRRAGIMSRSKQDLTNWYHSIRAAAV